MIEELIYDLSKRPFDPARNFAVAVEYERINQSASAVSFYVTYGLVLDIGGYEKNVITLAPSLLISEEEIDLGIQLFEALLKRCGAE